MLNLEFMKELYFYVLAINVPIGDTYHREKKDQILEVLKNKVREQVPNFLTPEWFAKRRKK